MASGSRNSMEVFSNRVSRAFSVKADKRDTSKTRSEVSDFNGLFVLDDKAKKPSKDNEKKIHELAQKLSTLGYTNIPEARIEYVVRAKNVDGDADKAWQLWLTFDDAVAGRLRPYNPKTKMLGAENREKVTCYLDALLFAMLAKVDVFEALLYQQFDDEPRQKLVTILRLWVNMLRTGKLITTDITQKLQEILAECGYQDAGRLRQQDAEECFGNITSILQMPLLTLKTDLFHTGKQDMDSDHKFITERLLNVAIPEEGIKQGHVTLEKCLEEYFNNRVEVKRELRRRNTVQSQYSRKDSTEKDSVAHVETEEVDSALSSPALSTPIDKQPNNLFPRPSNERTASIFAEKRFDQTQQKPSTNQKQYSHPPGRRRQSSVRKEVLMPAWQFLNLIPWYTDNANDGGAQIASHFSKKRPMLGISLKRYDVKNGHATRLPTHVDIPLEMRSPYFDCNDFIGRPNISTSDFKLVLESVVCHRGTTPNSGHYIALARAWAPVQGSSENFASTSREVWLQHDDLAAERVTVVDINKALQDEAALPYLLFYRVRPIDEDVELSGDPPPYEESENSFITVDQKLANYQNESRPSSEVSEQPTRRASRAVSLSDTGTSPPLMVEPRVHSMFLPDMSNGTSAKSENTTTGQTTPIEETRSADAQPNPRPATKAKSARPSLEIGERLRTGKMGKLSSRFSRDRLASIDAAPSNNERASELSLSNGPTAKEGTKTQAPTNAPVEGAKPSKPKDKLNRFKTVRHRNRRGNGSKEPDRECAMM